MSYNWTITDGDIYVSKNGNDVTGDGSMSLPYASINKATDSGSSGNKIVIGTGLWQEARGTSVNVYVFEGDGDSIIDGDKESYFESNKSGETFNNLTFQNYKVKSFIVGILIIGGHFFNFNKCKFYNVSTKITYSGAFTQPRIYFKDCILDDWTDGYTGYHTFSISFESCIVRKWNTVIKTNTVLLKCINTILLEAERMYISSIAGEWNYCNIIGNIWVSFTAGGMTYTDLSEIKTRTVSNTYTNENSFSLDPKFNNESIGDYTLQPDSPCLFAGKNNAHIGAYGVGYNFDANSSEFTEEVGAIFSQSDVGSGVENDIVKTSQTINGVTTRYFILNTDHTEGTIESEWIDFQTLYELNSTKLFANFIYDEDGIATSRVDIDNNDTGEFPNQYDFEMKTALDEDDKDTATWQETIWNKELSNVSARFVKLKIYMKG